jgi:hypothetical protein
MDRDLNPERVVSFVPFVAVNPTHTGQPVNVVFDSADDDGLAIQVLENASEIAVQFLP